MIIMQKKNLALVSFVQFIQILQTGETEKISNLELNNFFGRAKS